MRLDIVSTERRQATKVFNALIQECQLSSPTSKLSEKLRRSLDGLSQFMRTELVARTHEGCAPLFLASKNGAADLVDYLLSFCGARLEQRGLYEVLDEGISHHVTPLWCAAVSGRLAAVKVLLRHGADVNAVSDSGSTPIRSACYIVRNGLNTAHFDIIKCLVRAGADVQQPNHFGGTCLINSVQSPDLVKFLLSTDINVNAQDVQHKTALHYAVQENRLESAKLLLTHGANPFMKSKYGDDVLQTACLKGALMIFNYLLETVVYEPSRIADAFELIGSTFLLDMHDLGSTLFFWRKALEIRHEGRYSLYPKFPPSDESRPVHSVLGVAEIDSKSELESISGDLEQLKAQALLISERILGAGHKDTIFRYMYTGASHADANEYAACIRLWNYALLLKVHKETLLSCDTSFTARAIVQLYINILLRAPHGDAEAQNIGLADVLRTTAHLNSGLATAVELLRARPVCKAQLDNFDIVLATWVHLLFLLLRLAAAGAEDMERVYALAMPVIGLDPRAGHTGDSLLHLAVSSSSTLKSNCFLDAEAGSNGGGGAGLAQPLFPCPQVISFLLRCGVRPHVRNALSETPLHTACKMENYAEPVCRLLLAHGHMDAPDSRGITPLDIMQTHGCKIHVMPFVTLKCLAVQAVLRAERDELLSSSDLGPLPPNLGEFVRLHKTP